MLFATINKVTCMFTFMNMQEDFKGWAGRRVVEVRGSLKAACVMLINIPDYIMQSSLNTLSNLKKGKKVFQT